jgi:error-prone DNA polymerase
MTDKGIAPEFAQRVFDQIRGFGEYGFPESHAASFALIAYATSWMRCHYMAEFSCGLLNAQPMGFYSVATIVGDAIRHGVEVRPIEVDASDWDCTLEPDGDHVAIRMGLRYVKGLGESDWDRIRAARDARRFASLEDFVLRTRLDEGAQSRLAEAGAFACFGTSRRDALWQVRKLVATQDDSLRLPERDASPGFRGLGELETVLWDYGASDHSTRAHPLSPLRAALRERGLPDARTVQRMPNGRRIRYAGIVICRQRPGTAGGVTFMTLEDETGFVNAIIWKRVFDQYSVIGRTQAFLGITGKLQVEHGIVHLVADQLWVPDLGVEPAAARSHDFH